MWYSSFGRRRAGVSLAISLLVLSVMVVIGFASSAVGLQGLSLAVADRNARGAFYSAEAGLAQGASLVEDDSTLSGALLTNQSVGGAPGNFTVSVVNNLSSRSSLFVSGDVLPPACALFTSSGQGETQSMRRTLRLMALARTISITRSCPAAIFFSRDRRK
ncbi:MAG: hypothetical protein FJX76_05715 [Armatimonadetes bacterium]|nr:hypothetical protein [Armatimonadota bacterium]